MADITAGMVKELRERTQAGMMDCKKALTEAQGDMVLATEILAKKGLTKGQNAQSKIAAEGMVSAIVAADGRRAVAIEVNCQTDFVAKGEDFRGLVSTAATAALAHGTPDAATLTAVTVAGKTLGERAVELAGRSGEKHDIRRVALFEAADDAHLQAYIHHGAQLAVLVEVRAHAASDPRVAAFAEDVALQVASMHPRFLSTADVPAEMKAHQREIFSAQMDKEDAEAAAAPGEFIQRVQSLLTEQAAEEGRTIDNMDAAVAEHFKLSDKDRATLDGLKKAATKGATRAPVAREKILDGKVAKWLTEIVLLDQTSVRDNTKTIGRLQTELAAHVSGLHISRFVRYAVGEGIEKGPAKDFATEVAEMTGRAPA